MAYCGRRTLGGGPWHDRRFAPRALSPRALCYFSAFENVRTFIFKYFNTPLFIPGVERYFGHFSPALRSVQVFNPIYTPRQQSHFLSLFPNLDNIKIYGSAHLSNKSRYEAHSVPHPEGGWRFVTSIRLRLGRDSSLQAVAYGSIMMDLWEVGGWRPPCSRRVLRPWIR
jgi:hypothetical protein